MNALSWIGASFMIAGAAWAFLIWALATARGTRSGSYWIGDPSKILHETTGLVRAVTSLIRVRYGFPALLFLGGLAVLIIGQATR